MKPRPCPDGLYRSTVHYSDGTVKKTTTARAIMEVHLNRKLTHDEYVMYRDGDPKNLSYKNLELVSREEHFKRINSCSVEKSDGHSKVHPNLNLNYFEKIDTQEKAYWLGFLAADGCVKEKNYAIQFGLKISDIETVRNFAISIGANPEKVRIIKTKATKNSNKIYEAAYLVIHNKIFYTNLVKCGIVPRKSKIIRIPEFIKHDEQKLYAYALGYFDGNGFLSKNKKPSGTICSGSIGFLQDLKEVLNINHNIRKSKTCYAINIPADILKKMYDSYENSMPRKRKVIKT